MIPFMGKRGGRKVESGKQKAEMEEGRGERKAES
jgi:hypothetical protein